MKFCNMTKELFEIIYSLQKVRIIVPFPHKKVPFMIGSFCFSNKMLEDFLKLLWLFKCKLNGIINERFHK